MNEKLIEINKTSMSYVDPTLKASYLRLAKKALKEVMSYLPEAGNGKIRSNMGGIAVSGEVTAHYDRIYVDISQSCIGPGNEIMYRSCAGQKDYEGGVNNFAPLEDLLNPAELAEKLRRGIK